MPTQWVVGKQWIHCDGCQKAKDYPIGEAPWAQLCDECMTEEARKLAHYERLREVAEVIDREAPEGLMTVWGEGTVQIRIQSLRRLREALRGH